MDTATAERSTTTSEPEPGVGLDAAAPAQEGGFDLAGTLEDPATKQTTGEPTSITVADLRDGFKTGLARAIDFAAPNPGSELEVSVLLRCPIRPPVGLAGKLAVKVTRAPSGLVTTLLTGNAGLSVGDSKACFGDLLAMAALQGQGKTAERSAEMLTLALEDFIRSLREDYLLEMLQLIPSLASIPQFAMILAGMIPGLLLAPWIADCLFGSGNRELVIEGMQDGESAQFQRGAGFGGQGKKEGRTEVGAEGTMGAVDQTRIVKNNGQVTDQRAAAFIAAAKLGGDQQSIGGIGGSGELNIYPDSTNRPAGFLKLAGKAVLDPSQLSGHEQFWASFVVGALATARAWLEQVPESQVPMLGPIPDQLDEARKMAAGPIALSAGLIGAALNKLGLAKMRAGIEVAFAWDFASGAKTIQFQYVASLERSIPGGGKAGGTEKVVIVGPLPLAL
jgi:hypothetical protein